MPGMLRWKDMKMVDKIGNWYRETALYRHVLSAIAHPKRFAFLMRYPFWKSRNVWTDRFCGYGWSMYDWIPEGWRNAFGEELTHDIAEALKADGIKRSKWCDCLQWQDIKEKYGGLRLYAATTDKVQKVLSKYECMSIGYCINCGKPARYRTLGWIEYLCDDCIADCRPDGCERLSDEDVPTYCICLGGEDVEQTPLERFGIDLRKIWGLDD